MKVKLNERQIDALQQFLKSISRDRAPSTEFEIRHGQLFVEYSYLHSDGEWATYPEKRS